MRSRYGSLPAISHPAWRLALAWLAGFTLIDSSIVSLALPDIAQQFNRPVAELAWVSTGFLLALAATLLLAGRLSDRYGVRRVLAAGAVGFFAWTLASGAAPSFELLIAARIAQGIAGGILYTVSLAIVVTAFPPERRATAIGIYFTSGALGGVLGPVLGGWLTDLGGWRLVFFAQLPIPLFVGLGALVLLPPGGGRQRSLDLPGVAMGSLFVVSATLALLQWAEPGAGATAAVAGLVAALALGAFIGLERRAPEPAVRLAIFRNPRFVVSSAAGAAAWFAILSSTIYPALYLQLGRAVSATDAGLLLLPSPLVGLAFFPFAGRVMRGFGVDRTLLAGLLLLAGSGILMVTWSTTTSMAFILATNTVVGAGLALTLVASATDAMAQFTPEEAGTGSAVFNSLRQLGAAMGVAVPALAFELVAGGSRATNAALAGSTAAFAVRLAVLTIPVIVFLVVDWRSSRS